MFSSKKKASYATVPSDEGLDDNSDDLSQDLENLEREDVALTGTNKHGIRRQQPNRGSAGFVRCYSILILTLVGVAAMMAIAFFLGQSFDSKVPNKFDDGQKSLPLFPQTKDVDSATVEDILTQSKSAYSQNKQIVHYDPTGLLQRVKAFDFDMTETQARDVFQPPSLLNQQNQDFSSHALLGYLKSPNIVDSHVVFCSEGDAFVATIPSKGEKSFPAIKLTKTVGNVLDPKLHPSLRYLAYTATYTGRRELYLMDLLRPQSSAIRLTYWDSSAGVSGLIGWWGDSLVFRAMSNEISFPDMRLYVLHLSNIAPSGDGQVSVSQIDPIPLSQAIDASRHGSCWYFVRFSQSSQTIRYVGGTAESLWKYCDDEATASALTSDFNGTSKSPQVYNDQYLFFLSDRAWIGSSWKTDRMNVWAMPLAGEGSDLIQITDTSCDFEGRTIREYSIDAVTGNLVVRIGADLYLMQKSDIESKLSSRRLSEQMSDVGGGNVNDASNDGLDASNFTGTTNSSEPLPEHVSEPSNSTATTSGYNVSHTAAEAAGSSSPNSTAPKGTENDGNKTTAATVGSSNLTSPTTTLKAVSEDDGNEDVDNSGTSDDQQDPESMNYTQSSVNKTTLPDNTTADSVSGEYDNDASNSSTEGSSDLAGHTPTSDDGSAETGIELDTLAATHSSANDTAEEEVSRVYYQYNSPTMESRKSSSYQDHHSGTSTELKRLPIIVHSDFSSHQERLIPVNLNKHKTSMDIYTTTVGTTHAVMTLRGQLWVTPVVDDGEIPRYKGGGMNMPPRQYRVAPGATMGGAVRILAVRHVPNPIDDGDSDRRLALILATDPLTDTAEHAFYLIETQAGVTPSFLDADHLPKPFLGGHVGGGRTFDGGLGSVKPDTVALSPCGRRMSWSDTDGRIMVMNMPQYQDMDGREKTKFELLPKENELGEPMVGDEVDLRFSPGGRYLAVEHNARNQFRVISIVDLGDAEGEDKVADIRIDRIVQGTPSRFNSVGAYWGKSSKDVNVYQREATLSSLLGTPEPKDVATTLYFLSDRDIQTDVFSPWGTRQPMPHFKSNFAVFALPLLAIDSDDRGSFSGGGASELLVQEELEKREEIQSLLSLSKRRKLGEANDPLSGVFGVAEESFSQRRRAIRVLQESTEDSPEVAAQNETQNLRNAEFPIDLNIDFGTPDLAFARKAYRVANIPESKYIDIICQTPDASALVLIEEVDNQSMLSVFTSDSFPSDSFELTRFTPRGRELEHFGLSSSRDHFYIGFGPDGVHVAVPNTLAGISKLFSDDALDENVVHANGIHLSVWPALEYRQIYDDAWRMLRDYYYDPDMTGIDWPVIHERYLPLVARCAKREELDDVLAQMASELSALHVFVYGGEYERPQALDRSLQMASAVASLGAVFKRSPEWKGYEVVSIPERDPDFNIVDGIQAIYSPLSDQSLRLTGQRGLKVGDVIVGVNGESVMRVPDIHMLLRGMVGRSVRLDVLRLASDENGREDPEEEVETKPLITVPLHPYEADDLRYYAWEWRTRQAAEELAKQAGFSVGYVHLRDMSGPEAENAFARGFFPNYDKDAFILDVRHNHGGNIDSWILDVLQRQAWMYWKSRDFDPTNGGLGWDQQFAFRGHIVVLIDEKTSSDGEGVARGISELGLGRLVGTRTWGGGIWLASDNHLVDGGIATAPEIGTFSNNFGWGLGIEQMGVEPDIVVDNDPHQCYDGKDTQLERAIGELDKWIQQEPVVMPEYPEKKKDMTMGNRECSAR